MKRGTLMMVALVALGLIVSQAESQPGAKDARADKGAKDVKGAKDGKAGKGPPPRFELGDVFPGPLLAELKLTPAQEKELDGIKKDLKAKLNKILTDDQKKVIENFRPRGPGGPGAEKDGKGPPGKDGKDIKDGKGG